MQNKSTHLVVFALGLLVIAWIAWGYVPGNLLALAFTALVALGYLAGARELMRYRAATAGLAGALAGLEQPPSSLGEWLARLDPSLQAPVRLRVEGERVALPAPALTPYLVGMVVLLGMLGTLLGMMATLRGTGLALESASDLQAIRASLAAPVRGLGFAFGTSIAGVAASAMLGLMAALARRERQQVVQLLDARCATVLHGFSQAHQREQAFVLMQEQTRTLPTLVERLQAMADALEQHGQAAGERQLASQQAFEQRSEQAQLRQAEALERALRSGVAEGAQATAGVLQPVVEQTMTALARQSEQLRGMVEQAVQRQLDALASRFEDSTAAASQAWQQAAQAQQDSHAALAGELRSRLEAFSAEFAGRAGSLVEGVLARLDGSTQQVGAQWQQALARQDEQHAALVARQQEALEAIAGRLDAQSSHVLAEIAAAQARLQDTLVAQDAQRLEAWRTSLVETGSQLRQDWQQAGAQALQLQQDICQTLSQTASEIGEQARTQAAGTIGEVARLVETAAEAPRAAAEVIAGLREQLSAGMARDNAVLEERSRMLATVETLLSALNHASNEQRAAIDALVTSSSELLERVGTQFGQDIQAQAGRLDDAAAQLTASAVDVASLGEAFGAAVEQFGQGNAELANRLLAIEEALARNLARSDEQLAYYVAQAREVIDLSMLSQKQIVEDLQQLAASRAAADA